MTKTMKQTVTLFIGTLIAFSSLAAEDPLSKHQAHLGAGDCKSCKCWIDGVKVSDDASFSECGNLLIRWVLRKKPNEKIVSEPELTADVLYFGGKPFNVIEVETCKDSCE